MLFVYERIHYMKKKLWFVSIVRRSKRQRTKPVEYWRNEKVVYEMRRSGESDWLILIDIDAIC